MLFNNWDTTMHHANTLPPVTARAGDALWLSLGAAVLFLLAGAAHADPRHGRHDQDLSVEQGMRAPVTRPRGAEVRRPEFERGTARGVPRATPPVVTRGASPVAAAPVAAAPVRVPRATVNGNYRPGSAYATRGPNANANRRNGYVFDSRFHHDHYYPPRGYIVPRIDPGTRFAYYGRNRYYYRSGAWYRPYGTRWIVVAPPRGLVVSFLPDFYTTLWFGGIPYYYANDTYYVWRSSADGYVVTDPPDNSSGSSDEASVAPVAADDFYVYPMRGQSEDLQASDRYECHRWAVSQTGFDPSEPGGGVPDSQNSSRRQDYRRAMTACLEGRGYSVK